MCFVNLLNMEQFFTYEIYDDEYDATLRIGKGNCPDKSETAVVKYLRKRYGAAGWDSANISWHASEAAALKNERRKLDEHANTFGELPISNQVRGGGGRQMYVKCKAVKTSGEKCCNDAIAGNYGFCGIHRR
jgi:hypothetical protein